MSLVIPAVVDGTCARCGKPYAEGVDVVHYGQGYRHHPVCDTRTPRGQVAVTEPPAKRTGNYSRPHVNAPLGELEVPGEWVDAAACRNGDPERFFAEGRAGRLPPGGTRVDAYAVARQTCRGCPVRTECLDYALRTELGSKRHGMWGGTTPLERDELSRQRRRAS